MKVAFHTQVMLFRMLFHNIVVGELRLDSIWGMMLYNLFYLNPNYGACEEGKSKSMFAGMGH